MLKVCRDCGAISKPGRKLQGSGCITVLLLLMWIIPGIIYMIWRRGNSEVCAKCGGKNLIPADSPIGKKFIKELEN